MTMNFLNPVTTQTWTNGRHLVRCVKVIQETWDVRTFCFMAEQPVMFFFKPGQFVTLELEQARAPVPRLQDDLLTATLLGCLHSRLLPEERPQPGRPLDLATLDRFIDRHLASHLTVADLAQEACLSEAHFSEQIEPIVARRAVGTQTDIDACFDHCS